MPHERRCPTVRYVVTRDDVFGRRWCRPSDLRLAVVIAIVELAGSHFATRGHPNATPLDAGGYLLLVAGPAALLVRRRWPAQVLLTVFAVTFAYRMLGYPAGPVYLAPAIAYFSAVGAGRRWLARGTLAAAYGAFLWLPPLVGHGSAPSIGFAVGSPPGCSCWPPSPRSSVPSGLRGSSGAGPVRSTAAGGRARSGCGSPGNCTTSSPTTSP